MRIVMSALGLSRIRKSFPYIMPEPNGKCKNDDDRRYEKHALQCAVDLQVEMAEIIANREHGGGPYHLADNVDSHVAEKRDVRETCGEINGGGKNESGGELGYNDYFVVMHMIETLDRSDARFVYADEPTEFSHE